MSAEEDHERFVTLETKLAYQEKLLSDLNEVLLERGSEIDLLKARVASLERQVREGGGPDPGHEAPPHY
jgi:uncharacterized coiled-coil protein SlyX